jgi:hypothetical protein
MGTPQARLAPRGQRARGALLALAFGSSACSLLFDDTGLDDGDAGRQKGGGATGGTSGKGSGASGGAGGAGGTGNTGGRGGSPGTGGGSGTGGGPGTGGSPGTGGGMSGGSGSGGDPNASPYADAVIADGASIYFRLNEPVGAFGARSIAEPVDAVPVGSPSFDAPGVMVEPGNTGVKVVETDVFTGDVPVFKPGVNNAFAIDVWLTFSKEPLPDERRCVAGFVADSGTFLSLVANGVRLSLELSSATGQSQTVSFLTPFKADEPRYVGVTFDGELAALCEGRSDGASSCSGVLPFVVDDAGPYYPVFGNDVPRACGFGGVLDEIAYYPFALPTAVMKNHRSIGFNAGVGKRLPPKPRGGRPHPPGPSV